MRGSKCIVPIMGCACGGKGAGPTRRFLPILGARGAACVRFLACEEEKKARKRLSEPGLTKSLTGSRTYPVSSSARTLIFGSTSTGASPRSSACESLSNVACAANTTPAPLRSRSFTNVWRFYGTLACSMHHVELLFVPSCKNDEDKKKRYFERQGRFRQPDLYT